MTDTSAPETPVQTDSARATATPSDVGDEDIRREPHRLQVFQVPRHATKKEIIKFLEASGVQPFRNVKRIPRKPFAQITFDALGDLTAAETILSGREWKGRTLRCEAMDPKAVPEGRKRAAEGRRSKGADMKRRRLAGEDMEVPQRKTMVDAVTPLWRVPYPEQLSQKFADLHETCVLKVFRRLKTQWKKASPKKIPAWLQPNVKAFQERLLEGFVEGQGYGPREDGALKPTHRQFRYHFPLAAGETDFYRNKCEFTFGQRIAAAGSSVVVPPEVVRATWADNAFVADANDEAGNGEAPEAPSPAPGNAEESQTRSESAPMDADESILELGFRTGAFHTGDLRVVPPTLAQTVPLSQKMYCRRFRDLLRARPTLPPFDTVKGVGCLRTLTLRTSARTGDVTAIMVVCLRHEAHEQEWARLRGDLVEALERPLSRREALHVYQEAEQEVGHEAARYARRLFAGTGRFSAPTPNYATLLAALRQDVEQHFPESDDGVTASAETSATPCLSLFVQRYDGLSAPGADDPIELFWSSEAVAEGATPPFRVPLLNCTFHVSPAAFFQTNLPGAEVLFGEVLRRSIETVPSPDTSAASAEGASARPPAPTLVLDVCCGSGTIGLLVAKALPGQCHVIGIELCVPAVEDARRNAFMNGIDNAEFIAGKAEEVLQQVLKDHKLSKISPPVAIVDPPRSGLHRDCLRALRNAHGIRRLIYVSCNPGGSLAGDLEALCGPPSKRFHGKPFMPIDAQPVDMFPHTKHCEMVVVLER